MSDLKQALSVKCPTCGKKVVWASGNPFRPFCCERCKLIDLGEWANEEKIIPGDPLIETNEHDENIFFQ